MCPIEAANPAVAVPHEELRACCSKQEVDISFFVACYNEYENIVATLNEVVAAAGQFSLTWEIIVIDDASTDGSPARVRQYMSEHPALPISLIVREQNQGLAENFFYAARIGRGTNFKLVCGDNVECKEQIQVLLRRMGEADILIPAAHILGRKLSRRILSLLFTSIVNLISGYSIKYYNGCSVHLRSNVNRLSIDRGGFDFQARLIVELLNQGKTFVEIPVIHHERTFGRSSAVTWKNIRSALDFFLELLVRRFRSKDHGYTSGAEV